MEDIDDNIEANLVQQAKTLIEQLEDGDSAAAMETINELYKKRDYGLYQEIGKLTRNIHNAIQNFQIDIAVPANDKESVSRMNDASDRLNYVITLTENAANKTMDMVEDTIPISKELGDTANKLQSDWKRLLNREMSAEEFRNLYKEMSGFLEFTATKTHDIDRNLSSILLAQDYQDLTGQVIKRVIALVSEVQKNLVEMVTTASNVEMITGIAYISDVPEVEKSGIEAEGPAMDADNRDDVVSGQDEVDDLLSSLGF